MKKIILGILITGLAGSAFAVEKSELEQRIQTITEKFTAMQQSPDSRVPANELAAAKGIVLIDRTGGAFFVGVHSGYGVALMRDKSGNWSAPSFVSAGGASLGPQIGGTKDIFVVLAETPDAAETLKQSSLDFGVQASATGGNSHAGAEANTGSQQSVVIYSQNKGLYAGASLKGGSVKEDGDANAVYYGSPVSAEDIFRGQVTTTSTQRALDKALVDKIEEYSR
jgi:lipid-binding SYLF domain-containing protein